MINRINQIQIEALNDIINDMRTGDSIKDIFDAVSDCIYKHLALAEMDEDANEDTVQALRVLNEKVYHLCERGKREVDIMRH